MTICRWSFCEAK